MAQAKRIATTAAPRAATRDNVIDMAEARRVALFRRLWANHDMDGRARNG